MNQNILVTGAAGYIGGTVLANFLRYTNGPIKSAKFSAAVRTPEQAKALSKLAVGVVQLDLTDPEAVARAILSHEIDIVVHTASMVEVLQVTHLIKALGQRRRVSGQDAYFINSAATSMYSAEGGWPYGQVKDTDPIYELEKEIGRENPVRATNLAVVELGKEFGVKTFNVPLPPIYGRGLGEVKKLSLPIPYQVRAAIASKKVHKFSKQGNPPAVHVGDVAALYTLIVEKILLKEPIPSDEKGFYFPIAHRWPWWEVLQGIANSLHARGLVTDPVLQVWPDWDVAANALALPRMYIEPITMSTGDLIAVNAFKFGWQPRWNKQRFLESLDAEVQDALDLDTFQQTGYDFLMK